MTTRCVCGDASDNDGFMIQCEACDVWQHGSCIGIKNEDVPEMYYCELCSPDDPIHVKRRKYVESVRTGRELQRKRNKANEKGKGMSETEEVSAREQRKLEQLMEQFRRIEDRQRRNQEDILSGKNNNSRSKERATSDSNQKSLSRSQSPPVEANLSHLSAREARAQLRQVSNRPDTKSRRERLRKALGARRGASKRKLTEAEIEDQENDSLWQRRRRLPLTPCYLGFQSWLLKDYNEEVERADKRYDVREQNTKYEPYLKRMQRNYELQQEESKTA